MATISLNGSGVGTALRQLLLCDDIEPGSDASYALCKTIYVNHPLGKKLADTPISLAQSQPRDITIPNAPDRVTERFREQWERDGADGHIFNLGSLSRIYGVAAVGLMIRDAGPMDAVDYWKLADQEISFNVWDALNLAGSQVLNLNPNDMDFLKPTGISVAGTPYHRSRSIVKIHEKPIYLYYANAGYGFTGRSVYLRAIYPLKSFVRTMITDEMVARKAGLLIAKMVPPGSFVDGLMTRMFGIKRQMLQEGETDNVLGITPEEAIETLNMQNVNTAMEVSRKNILDNTATAADMPAVLLNQETFAEGFGEGVEDAKSVARYIGGVRDELALVYAWFDKIIQHRAWSPSFFKTMQSEFSDQYGAMEYKEAFYEWQNAFRAPWPSLIEEPDSERVKVADAKLKAAIALVEVLMPALDPENKAIVIQWCCDNFNQLDELFQSPLDLDFEALANYEPPQPIAEPGEPKPFAAQDAAGVVEKLKGLVRAA